MNSIFGNKRAFTLIELLIVVAIIAILAAIAVPNFLEAQTRSKVSRAKADMRSVATGLESYAVDYNKYPPGHVTAQIVGSQWFNPTGLAVGQAINPRIVRLRPLTTPVAYLTSVPPDVFSQEEATASASATTNEEIRTFLYIDRRSYEESVPNAVIPTASSNGSNLYRVLFGAQYPAAPWALRSRGPRGLGTGTAALGNSVDITDAYDPSNGTVSTGNIFMIGGVGFPN